jgi:geranylgeranylglycerol-phosphate geranylgeranyltransferase
MNLNLKNKRIHLVRKLFGIIRLVRPNNVIIAILSVLLVALLSGSFEPLNNIVLATSTAALIMVGANVINDICDIEIDRINKPNRPLVTRTVSLKEAYILFFISYICAWICALLISITMFVIAVFVGLLLVAYSYKFKRTILTGNLIVSGSTAAAFLYGGLAVHKIEIAYFPALFAFLYHFGREIIKDLQDVKGDSSAGAHTLAIQYGSHVALRTVFVIFAVLIVVTIVPYILGIYGLVYMLIVIFGVYPVLGFVWYQCWKNPEPENLGLMSNLLKADMLVGLVAIYFG